jgi:hypothetical protein
MKKITCLVVIFFLLISVLNIRGVQQENVVSSLPPTLAPSLRNSTADVLVVSESDPFFGLISTSAACWYDKTTNTTGLLPLLIPEEGTLTSAQLRFLESYLPSTECTILVVGEHLNTSYQTIDIQGSPPAVSLLLAAQTFTTAPAVLIIPYDTVKGYQRGLLAAPLASYLNIPILLYDENEIEIQSLCSQLHTSNAYVVGDITLNLTNVTQTLLVTEQAIMDAVLSVIKEQFGSINYLTMTNPSDVIPPAAISTTNVTFSDHLSNKKIIILSKEVDIYGNDTWQYSLSIPDDITRIQISGELLQKKQSLFERVFQIAPLLFMTLTDSQGRVVAYANSMGYSVGKTYLETLTCNASGTYSLQVTVYNGMKGGFFVQRGFSRIDADIHINTTITTVASPHLPVIPNLSCIAPYLTAAHGGLLIANSTWELTDDTYTVAAQGSGTGPWYNASLHPFTNNKVNSTIDQLQKTLESLQNHDLLNGYLSGPAWLAILADPSMVPMYYFSPSQEGIPERGLPSDNPYSLQENLSVGRLIGWDVQDVSVLIARTFFYEALCGQPENAEDWHSRFSFVFGEGYSETGGIFHQIPYAKEIRAYGFNSNVYGDFRNSRQIAEFLHIYTGANYIEYLGHGDWFWFPASLYGVDMYSKAIDVAHAKDWVYDKPSIFLSSACLMGRTDGLPPQMTIGLTMLHAGCNGFVGATRETGQESGLTILENHLIVDDWSVGEALRGEKRIDTELPTYYVRVLYGDPAFNPYEPLHGFSDQGRPMFNPV